MSLTTRSVRLLTRIAISALVFIVFALHVAASPRFEIIDRMENYLYDVRVRATMPGGIDERIVIVDIDEASQLQLGQWPWARDTLASIVDILFDDYRIKTLGFDVLFAEAGRGGAEIWLATHYNTPTVGHDTNLSAGMFATENVAERGRLCLSCHLGTNTKFATHRIMAAGHPRLAFELDTFTELWRTAGRLGLIGGPQFEAEGMFPELGFYDCHACHRSMKTVRWRPLPRHGGVGPGTPFVHDGTLVMSMALARAISPSDAEAFEAGLVALHRAGSDNVDSIRAAASRLDAILANLQKRLSPERLRGRELQLLREVLATGAQGNYLDYISAEQAFMAVQMLVIELDNPYLEDQLDRIADTLNNDERYRPSQFAAMLAAVAEPEPEAEDIDEQDE